MNPYMVNMRLKPSVSPFGVHFVPKDHAFMLASISRISSASVARIGRKSSPRRTGSACDSTKARQTRTRLMKV